MKKSELREIIREEIKHYNRDPKPGDLVLAGFEPYEGYNLHIVGKNDIEELKKDVGQDVHYLLKVIKKY